jgi:hypothetical protein
MHRKILFLLIISCLSIMYIGAANAHADPLLVQIDDDKGQPAVTLEKNEMGFTVHIGKVCIELKTDDDEDLVWALNDFGNPRCGVKKAPTGYILVDSGGDPLKCMRREESSWVSERADGRSLGMIAIRDDGTEIFDGSGKLIGTAHVEGKRVVISDAGGSLRFRASSLDCLCASIWFINGHGRDALAESAWLGALVRWGTKP